MARPIISVVDYLYTNIVNLGRNVRKFETTTNADFRSQRSDLTGTWKSNQASQKIILKHSATVEILKEEGSSLLWGQRRGNMPLQINLNGLPSARPKLRGKTPLKILHGDG